jgi:hypothetical protein
VNIQLSVVDFSFSIVIGYARYTNSVLTFIIFSKYFASAFAGFSSYVIVVGVGSGGREGGVSSGICSFGVFRLIYNFF